MDKNKERISASDAEKVSGGVVWKVNCPKCGKELVGGHGVSRVDGTIYEHPYFCEECAAKLTDAEKNKQLIFSSITVKILMQALKIILFKNFKGGN